LAAYHLRPLNLIAIRGHIFCSFLALVLRKELEDRLLGCAWQRGGCSFCGVVFPGNPFLRRIGESEKRCPKTGYPFLKTHS
jgi:hypothetical protein